MTERKWTSGPWTVPHFARPDVNCECNYILCDTKLGAICSVFCSGDGDDWTKHGDNPRFAEAVANAHIIAAAPELYEALENCLASLMRRIYDEYDGVYTKEDFDNIEAPYVAALAKARGESQ